MNAWNPPKFDAFTATVESFMKKRLADHRFASFDYCYNHFHPDNKRKNDPEKSCLALFSYLGSWGMLRMSGTLGQEKSIKSLEPTIQYIYQCKRSCWEIDVDNYATNSETILDLAEKIRHSLVGDNDITVTLLTKVLFGVFGFIPALDSLFQKTMHLNKQYFGVKSKLFKQRFSDVLGRVSKIYEINRTKINEVYEKKEYKTLVFNDGEVPKRYTKAKIIDMYGFYRQYSMK
jgi:hypothetical protein